MDAPPRKPGRPRVDPTDRSVDVHIRLGAKHYDQVYQQARAARLTLGEYVRAKLTVDAEKERE